jgi:hypothetical protein
VFALPAALAFGFGVWAHLAGAEDSAFGSMLCLGTGSAIISLIGMLAAWAFADAARREPGPDLQRGFDVVPSDDTPSPPAA